MVHHHDIAVAGLHAREVDLAFGRDADGLARAALQVQPAVEFAAFSRERVGAVAKTRADGAVVRHAQRHGLQHLQQVARVFHRRLAARGLAHFAA